MTFFRLKLLQADAVYINLFILLASLWSSRQFYHVIFPATHLFTWICTKIFYYVACIAKVQEISSRRTDDLKIPCSLR